MRLGATGKDPKNHIHLFFLFRIELFALRSDWKRGGREDKIDFTRKLSCRKPEKGLREVGGVKTRRHFQRSFSPGERNHKFDRVEEEGGDGEGGLGKGFRQDFKDWEREKHVELFRRKHRCEAHRYVGRGGSDCIKKHRNNKRLGLGFFPKRMDAGFPL